jgi:multiple sugar transport system permease protein
MRTNPWPMRILGLVAVALIVLMLAVVVLGPIYWVVLSSLKDARELVSGHPGLGPTDLTLENYVYLFRRTLFPTYFANSVVVAALTTVISVGIALHAAYSLRRFQFRGKGLISTGLLLVYMFPPIVLIIPLFQLLRSYGVISSPLSLVLVNVAFCAPFSAWLLESFFHSIPMEVEEAALMDGAGRLRILYEVFLPLTSPGLLSVALYSVIFSWSEYMFAVTFLMQEEKMTLPVGLSHFLAIYDINWGSVSAGAVATALPIAVLFGFLGRTFIKNVTQGTIK